MPARFIYVIIDLPSLRQRKEDISLLIVSFLNDRKPILLDEWQYVESVWVLPVGASLANLVTRYNR